MKASRLAALVAVCSLGVACATTGSAGDDSRLDERAEVKAAQGKKGQDCGADERPGDVLVLDARTGGPVTCSLVTLMREPASCPVGGECPSDVVFRGLTGPHGTVKLKGLLDKSRLLGTAEGFGPSMVLSATTKPGQPVELELAPAEGFWLKVLDPDGTYLTDVSLVFKQGDDVIAQLRSNTLANVFFAQKNPFSGQPVTALADGFQAITISGAADLGDDGHTLTLRR